MLNVSVNGQPRQVEEGVTILTLLRSLQIEVPTLCHDDRLRPVGACRLCSVELVGSERFVSACTTPVADGMQILTHSASVEADRKTNLALLASQYPGDEPLDEELEFHRYLIQYGLAPKGRAGNGFKDSSHPYLQVDMDRCVHCYRCVRICNEVQGQFVWRVWNRGDRTAIRPDRGDRLQDSSCVSCGACADTCPSGAIQDRSTRERGRPDHWVRTTCPYCGTGCEMEVGVRKDRILAVRPVLEAPVNRGHLCVKGRYAHQFVHSSDRIETPLLRTPDGWKQVSWDEAYGWIASRLESIRAESGPDSIGVLGSARATNEENYLAQKFARVVVGSNNVDCCARVCHAPSAAALRATLGTGAATHSFEDIESAAGFLVAGANPTENHPIVGARIKQAVLRGAKLVVLDPRRSELARFADVHLALRPGTNVPVLHAMANWLLASDRIDAEFIRTRTDGIEPFRNLVAEWTPERAGELAGVEPDTIRRAAETYASARPAMIFHGLGMTEHTQGTEGVRCLVNLALLTGNFGKPGSGENPLRGQNNVQGSAHMGCEPSNLAGYTPLEQDADRVEKIWGLPIPRTPGLTWQRMLDASVRGDLRALYAIGYDVYFSNPNSAYTADGLGKLDLLIVQDLFLNETAKAFAHVFLPACSSFEKDGTFMNSERRVQRVRKAISTMGESKPDWQILCELAARMGHREAFAFASPREIWDEVRQVWRAGTGISYDRIEREGLQWPCPDESHPGTKRLHESTFAIGDKAAFSLIPYRPTSEQTSPEFPFLLNTGRTLFHFNAGTMTMRTENRRLLESDRLEIGIADAGRLKLSNGDLVRLISRNGEVQVTVRVGDTVPPGQLFATFHDPEVFTNRLTGGLRDSVVGTPEYKVCAVRVEPLPSSERIP